MSTKVLLVDDQQLIRAGFRMILGAEPDIEVVGECANGAQAVDSAARLQPDVVLMDIRMPEMDGIEATRRIVSAGAADEDAAPRVLMLTTFDLDEYVYDALRAGASGFLLKDVSPDDLVHAVRVVARGDAMLAPAVTRRMLDRFIALPAPDSRAELPDSVSDRERQVLELVARGRSNAEIAADLYLSEATVKTYVSRLLTKLDARDRVQLAVWAYESGLVRVGDR